jgi:hypothetical protein
MQGSDHKPKAVLEGYLDKWVNMIYRWQKRYFILLGDTLMYSEKQGDNPKGKIHLGIANILTFPDDPLRIVIHSGMFEIHIKAEKLNEQKQWLHALNEAHEQALLSSEHHELYQNISEATRDLNPSIRKYLVTPHTEGMSDKLAHIWLLQAQMDEAISMVTPRMEKTGPLKEQFDKISHISGEIKVRRHQSSCLNSSSRCS